MDTRFSSAIHALVLIAESEKPMTSEDIAGSVGTNASYIRKIIGSLKKKDIIESHQGISGYALKPKAEDLTLLQIYQAVNETEAISLFDLHQNPNDQCIVGCHIKPVLTDMFMEMEEAIVLALSGKTLADCIGSIRKRLDAAAMTARGKKCELWLMRRELSGTGNQQENLQTADADWKL